MKDLPKILIIAGSDPSSGAGIQADLKISNSLKVYCAAVITSLTAQNSKNFYQSFVPPIEFFNKQLEAVLEDIEFDFIKIGMVESREIILAIDKILEKKAKNIPIILDTLIISTRGGKLLQDDALEVLKSKLIKKSYLITPNILEAEILSGVKIKTVEDIKKAALKLQKLGCKNVLIKGGHFENGSKKITNVLLDEEGNFYLIANKKLDLKEGVRGTGCRLATAITCNLAKKDGLLRAVKKANDYVFCLIKNSKRIGKGSKMIF